MVEKTEIEGLSEETGIPIVPKFVPLLDATVRVMGVEYGFRDKDFTQCVRPGAVDGGWDDIRAEIDEVFEYSKKFVFNSLQSIAEEDDGLVDYHGVVFLMMRAAGEVMAFRLGRDAKNRAREWQSGAEEACGH